MRWSSSTSAISSWSRRSTAPCGARTRRGRRRRGRGRGRASRGRVAAAVARPGTPRPPAREAHRQPTRDLDHDPQLVRALPPRSPGRYRCHDPVMRMWVCSTMPSSKRDLEVLARRSRPPRSRAPTAGEAREARRLEPIEAAGRPAPGAERAGGAVDRVALGHRREGSKSQSHPPQDSRSAPARGCDHDRSTRPR